MLQRHRLARGQGRDHRGGAGRLDAQHRRVCRALGQIGGDAGNAAAAADRHDDEVGLAVELIKQFGGDGALARHRARIVVRRHQRGTRTRDVFERRLRGHVIGFSDGDQLDEVPAVITDAVALLLRRLDRDVHPAVDAHRPARQRETLGVIARRRTHHAGGDLGVGQLHQQVVGAAQLVGPHRLQVLALEIDPGAGRLREPVADLQRAARDDPGNSLSSLVDVGRGQRRRARCSGSVRRSPVNGATYLRISVNRGEYEQRNLPVGLRLVLGVVGPRRHRAPPPRRPLVADRPRGHRSPWSRCRPATRHGDWP